MVTKKLQLKSGEERRLLAGHLWIYSNEVDSKVTPLKDFEPGEQCQVFTRNGKLVGTAMINPGSLICGRIVSRDTSLLDAELLRKRLESALALRQQLFDTPYYRLVFGESDLLPGLVIDRFGDHLCVQCNCAGMDRLTSEIVDALVSLLQPESILLRNDSQVRKLEGLEQKVESLYGTVPDEVELIENGVRFLASLNSGQKTGWFYDQRPNREWLRKHAEGKRVLDVFSYVGSFGVQAGVFGAREIHCVDSSMGAMVMAEKNSDLNGIEDRFSGLVGDAFEVLQGLYDDGERYDIVVIDPPAFIKKKKDRHLGLRGYSRINGLGMRLVKENGLLLSASCSMHLKRTELTDLVGTCAARQKRNVQILAQGSQGADHPVHPSIPETNYIKALLCRVGPTL